jgi:hypothetical protein
MLRLAGIEGLEGHTTTEIGSIGSLVHTSSMLREVIV